jgi:hypothetical protein
MKNQRWSATGRNPKDPIRLVVELKQYGGGVTIGKAVVPSDLVKFWKQSQTMMAVSPPPEAYSSIFFGLTQIEVPVFCEWLMCLLVDPEFQEDRLADFGERFNDLWVPKFGQRAAIAVYVWHVLRQSRLLDGLVRLLVRLWEFN